MSNYIRHIISDCQFKESRSGCARQRPACAPRSRACRTRLPRLQRELKGVPRNGGREQQLVCSCFALNSLHLQTIVLTDVPTPFLGTPLVPLRKALRVSKKLHLWFVENASKMNIQDPSTINMCIYIYIYIHTYIHTYIIYIYIYIYIPQRHQYTHNIAQHQ